MTINHASPVIQEIVAMTKKNLSSMLTLLAVVLLVAACTGMQSRSTLPARHPSAADS